jgi:hypothetical protein
MFLLAMMNVVASDPVSELAGKDSDKKVGLLQFHE